MNLVTEEIHRSFFSQRDGQQLAETGHRLKVPLPIEAEQIPGADAVLYTYTDGDHFGQKTAEILDRRLTPTFIAPPPVRAGLEGISVSRDRIIVVP